MPASQPLLPAPWMITRLKRPGEDGLLERLDQEIRMALRSCVRCSGIYEQTGLIPMQCDVCGATRDPLWVATLESLLDDPAPPTGIYMLRPVRRILTDKEA